MEYPIEIENLVKDYRGGFRAVDSLTLKVPHKAFLGFLGPNGAGKTTTIKVLTNMLVATSGKASLNGIDVMTDPKMALSDVGAVVETPEFYPYLTPIETLEYLGQLRGMSMTDIRRRSKEVLDVVKMTEWQDKRIGKFSKGMKQRLAIAQALLHEPSVIILDEPTSGLDPRGMFEMREVLRELKKGDYTVFMSSHLMNEVQEVCSRRRAHQPGQAAEIRQRGIAAERVPGQEDRGPHAAARWNRPITSMWARSRACRASTPWRRTPSRWTSTAGTRNRPACSWTCRPPASRS